VSVVRREARRRWLVVAALVAALCAVPIVIAALPVARSSLSADALRARVLASASAPYQGLVETRGSLGLPDLPGLSDVTGLLGGTTRMRVWHDSARRWRVDVITPTGERDLHQSPQGMSTWDYERNLFTRLIGEPPVRLPRGSDLTPPDLARRLLGIASPRDRVTALPARRVAGVAAAGLRVTPADPTTTVARVDVWADPDTGLPVAVHVAGKGGGGAVLPSVLSARFLDLRQRRPAASVLTATPPPGTPNVSLSAPDLISRLSRFVPFRLPDRLAGYPALRVAGDDAVRVYGTGYAAFAALPLPGRFGRRVMDAAESAGVQAVKVAGPVGVPRGDAFLIRTPLLTALIVSEISMDDRTFLLAGPVDQKPLVTAAQQLIMEPG
jgi:hypothetical protein